MPTGSDRRRGIRRSFVRLLDARSGLGVALRFFALFAAAAVLLLTKNVLAGFIAAVVAASMVVLVDGRRRD